MTPDQSLFNDAYLGLKSQGFRRSLHYATFCRYRSSDGLRCAIGHCIPDEDYRPDFEGKTFFDHPGLQAVLKRRYPGMTPDLAEALQDAHDDNEAPGRMEAALISVASKFHLEVPQ